MKFKTNQFLFYALEYSDKLIEEAELRAKDMTEMFFDELIKMHKSGELINGNINAPPTRGKSTVGFAIGHFLMPIFFKRKFTIHDIDRDQQEFSKNMRNPELKNTLRIIDEWNELETTGENSTIEQSLLNHMSDVQAQRFVHKFSCSPKDAPDKNADIFLEVITPDKVNKITHCLLYYKFLKGGIEIMQLLGHVNIDVSDVLEEEWYKEYRRRKFEKMELITREGIFRPRMLDYAPVILSVVEDLKTITKLGLLNKDIIGNYITNKCHELKIPITVVGHSKMIAEVNGILSMWKSYFSLMAKWRHLDRKLDNEKIEKEKYQEQTKMIDKMTKDLMNAIELQMESLRKKIDIKEKYDTILTTE